MATRPLVVVVDDDDSVRESLPDLIKELGFAAQAFPSAASFLASTSVDRVQCLVLDVSMPVMSGPELQQELVRRGVAAPIVYITGIEDRTIRERLLAQGAVECLFKPFSEAALLAAILIALRRE